MIVKCKLTSNWENRREAGILLSELGPYIDISRLGAQIRNHMLKTDTAFLHPLSYLHVLQGVMKDKYCLVACQI